MTDTPRNQIQTIDPTMVDALMRKRDGLLAERAEIRARQADLAARDREIDRDLADVQAAGRVFGIAVELPKEDDDRPVSRFLWSMNTGRGKSSLLADYVQKTEALLASSNASPAAKAVATKAEMPRVSDIVLDRLKAAGAKGSKAAPIQNYIEETYGREIHNKTVGMTLYRLAKDELVRRDGHTWFITEKGMNPGAVTPGPEALL